MKNLLPVIVTFLLLLVGCEQQHKSEEDNSVEHGTEIAIHSVKEGDVEIISVDGCEYIVYKEAEGTNHGYGYMAHKGNCSNPIHCHNRKSEDLKTEDKTK